MPEAIGASAQPGTVGAEAGEMNEDMSVSKDAPESPAAKPAALAYEQRSYSIEELKALGVDFGEDVYDA